MTHLNELYLILNKSLKWNKSHLKCFSLIMLAIILKLLLLNAHRELSSFYIFVLQFGEYSILDHTN